MSAEHDELFQLICGRTTTKAVERILAAGYRKPLTIENDKLVIDDGLLLLDVGKCTCSPYGSSHEYHCGVEYLDDLTKPLARAGYRKPQQVTTYDQLDALPDDSLVMATGKYLNGQGDFTDCWMRPLPDHVTGGTGARLWEVLVYLDGGVHNMTRNDCISLPATVLHVGGAE